MNRNVALSIATFLMVAASAAQAQDMLVASATSPQNVESPAATGGYEDPSWKEYPPFPRHFGPID